VFITPLPLLRLMERLGSPLLSELSAALATLRGSILGVIAARREQMAAGHGAGDDLLGALLLAQDEEGQPMTDEELWEDVRVGGTLEGWLWAVGAVGVPSGRRNRGGWRCRQWVLWEYHLARARGGRAAQAQGCWRHA
jgi:hypothetical protein